MEMELAQASQMLKFLDEERQKDKALITTLQERLEEEAQQLARHEEQLAAIQGSVGRIEALLARASEFAQTADLLKEEVAGMLDERERKRRREEQEAEHARRSEIDTLKDEVTALSERWRPTQLQDSLGALQADGQRLNEALQELEKTVTGLDKRSRDRDQTVTFLEEQRRSDNRRIAALEAETTELHKQTGTADTQLLVFEKSIEKERARLEEGLEALKVIEELRVADFRREQQVKKWDKQADEVRQEIKVLHEERDRFLQQYQRVKQALDRLEAFQARLETRQNEVAEMQRLAEDRIKQSWEEWQAAQVKEHRRWELEVEGQWKRQERTNKDHAGELKELRELVAVPQKQILALVESIPPLAAALQEQLGAMLERAQEAGKS